MFIENNKPINRHNFYINIDKLKVSKINNYFSLLLIILIQINCINNNFLINLRAKNFLLFHMRNRSKNNNL